MSDESKLYKEALERIDELVEEVVQTCIEVADENHYLQSQTVKRRLALGGDRRPIDIYMPLKQAVEIYEGGSGTTTQPRNALCYPKWVSTENDLIPHFGYNIMAQRVDGTGFTSGFSNYQTVRILTTIYLECKKVE